MIDECVTEATEQAMRALPPHFAEMHAAGLLSLDDVRAVITFTSLFIAVENTLCAEHGLPSESLDRGHISRVATSIYVKEYGVEAHNRVKANLDLVAKYLPE